MNNQMLDPQLELEEVDMYVLFARMFADISRVVEERFGEKGIEAIREGVRIFGERRGRDIADRARSMGHQNDVEHYLSCYDMGRSKHFSSDDTVLPHSIEQTFDQCVFARVWSEDRDEKYGIHYCQMIDPSIAHGYNSRLNCMHDRHFFSDGECHFVFEMDTDK